MSDNNKDGFNYTYSAKQQEEIKKIREKYEPPKEDKIERLINLDKNATKKAQAVGLIMGVIGTLILGFGMSLVMSELSTIFGLGHITASIIGIIVGLIGGAITVLTYPVYKVCLKYERRKIAPEIIRLSDELIK